MTGATSDRRPYAARLPPAERRDQLLDAALHTALDRGFHAVTVDGVARAAGVTRPVVYGLFADRAALLTALVERSEQRVVDQLAPVFPAVPGEQDDVDPDELLVDGVTAYLEAVRADPATWQVVLLPPEGSPQEMQQRANRLRRLLLAQLRQLVEWGVARRGGPALDVDLFTRSVFTLSEGAARLLLTDPQRWTVEAFSDFTRAVLSALHPDPR